MKEHAGKRSRQLAACLVVVGVGLLGTGCDQEDSAAPDAGFTIEDIVARPDEVVGEEVAVSAEVGNVFRPYAFTMGTGGGASVLVVSEDPVEVIEDVTVRAIGVVVEAPVDAQDTNLEVAEFVRNTVEVDYRHAVVAEEVRVLEQPGN